MQIDLLVKDNRPYTYENYATRVLQGIFREAGIESRKIVASDGVFHDYLQLLHENPPDWTLSFEDIFSMQKPFCDIVKIPHFYWKSGLLSTAIYYFNSLCGKVGCIDRKVANHFAHPFFPHPIGLKKERRRGERPFEVVLFQDLIDVESKKNTWKLLFDEEGVHYLLEAITVCKKNPHLHPGIVALKFSNDKMLLSDLVSELEEYLCAERTLTLIESLKNVQVHVFGEHVGNNWLLRLKNRENVHLHAPLPYTEKLEVLKLSKVLVRDQPPFSEASDEWVLNALNEGCFVFTNPNSYLSELLNGIDCFYNSFEELNDKIKKALQEEEPDFPKEILASNSWENRIGDLLNFMKPK